MKDYEKAVKHPSHYTEGRKFEPKDVIRDWDLNFNLGSALKYIARAGRKDDIVQDLKKSQEYLQFEIDAIEVERPKKVEPPTHPNCKCSVDTGESVHSYLFSILDMTASEFIGFIKSNDKAVAKLWRAGVTSYRMDTVNVAKVYNHAKVTITFIEVNNQYTKRGYKDRPNTLTVTLED